MPRLPALADKVVTAHGTPHHALAELEADTHLHVHQESNVLFARVLERDARATRA